VVTGAGRGIGRETARALARYGAAVVIAEISQAGAETERLIRKEGGRAIFVQTDVADARSVEGMKEKAVRAFGEVDILINDAVVVHCKPVLEHTVEEWDRVVAVNLRSVFLAIKAFVPSMLEKGSGVVVTMQTTEGMPYLAPYEASKAGLTSLVSALAQEIGEGKGVSVYAFGPGMVDTPALREAVPKLAALYGLPEEEFIKQSGGQMISAELCAVGLVGTVLHAAEFHGQETGYVAGLGKLGLGPDGTRWPAETGPGAVGPAPADPLEPAAVDLCLRALDLNRRMAGVIRDNIKEYDSLTMFQRPVIKRMFQQGTGLKVEEWLASAEDMTARLERAARREQDMKTSAPPARLAAYIEQLKKMAGFLTKQESDARGWIKDPKKLETAIAALGTRRRVSTELAAVLADMLERQGRAL
jgi:NAD(P)-dependent dehydrogenase (short-subunit alcohol dehydrogenase family)